MLQKQVIDISLAQGLNQVTEEKISQEGSIELKNARFNKVGEVLKSKGSTLVGTVNNKAIVTDAKGAVHAIGKSGTDTLSSNGWVRTSGFNGSPLIETSFINNDSYDHTECDSDTRNGFAAHVALLRRGASDRVILITLECLSTGVKISKEFNDVTAKTPKIFMANGFVYLFYCSYNAGNIITFRKFDLDLNQVIVDEIATFSSPANIYGIDACYDTYSKNFFVVMPDYHDLKTSDKYIQVNTNGVVLKTEIPSSIQVDTNGASTEYMTATIISNANYVASFVRTPSGVVGTLFSKGLSVIKRGSLPVAQFGDKITASFIEDNVFAVTTSAGEKSEYVLFEDVPLTRINVYEYAGSNYNHIESNSLERLSLASKSFFYDGNVYAIGKCIDDSNAHYFILNLLKGQVLGRFSPETAVRTDQDFSGGYGDYYAFNTLSKIAPSSEGVFHGSIVRKKASDQTDARRMISSVSSVDVKIDFASNVYSKALVGDSLLLTNGLTLEVDSGRAYENGFLAAPDVLHVRSFYDNFNNDHPTKTYSYCAVYEYYDSDGQLTRSAPSTIKTITTDAQTTYMVINFLEPLKSFKGMSNISSKDPVVVIYRTTHNGTVFHRCLEVLAGVGAINDNTSDNDLQTREMLYTTGGILQNDPAPIAKYSTSGGGRLFLAGLEVDEVAFSKKYLVGESIAFSDLFRISLATGGTLDKSKVSGLGYMDGKLFIFRRRSVYVVQGDGPNELGQNDSFTLPEIISGDVGCISHASIVNIPDGIMFQSEKGIWLITRGLGFNYIGAGVDDLAKDLIVSSVLSDKDSEVRFYTSTGKCLVYNYTLAQWSWSEVFAISADTFEGEVITSNGFAIRKEGGFLRDMIPYSMVVKTPWFKTMSIQGFARIWTAKILGKFKSAHKLRIRVFYDYDTSNFDEYIREPKSADKQYQYEIHLKRQKCEAIQFEISDFEQSGTGESMSLTGITLEAGIRKGSFKLPASRRT